MDDHPQPGEALPDPARRGFLKAAPLGALLVVAGGAAKAAPAVAPAPGPAPKRGYHETAHIRQYYQTAAYW
ncbi:MAG TPA: formate dehydrogenase [Telluria sp.]|jgi:hypothetical protein